MRPISGETGSNMSSRLPTTGVSRSSAVASRPLMVWRILSVIALLVMGAIHLYLKIDGVSGLLGVLFILNAIGAVVLAAAMAMARGRLLSLAAVLSLLFLLG